MITLADFLQARIADDEAQAAKHLSDAERHGWDSYPARVLAECDAKRRMIKQAGERIEAAEIVAATGGPDNALGRVDRTWQLGAGAAWHTVLRLLALPYAGHEDYRQEWKP